MFFIPSTAISSYDDFSVMKLCLKYAEKGLKVTMFTRRPTFTNLETMYQFCRNSRCYWTARKIKIERPTDVSEIFAWSKRLSRVRVERTAPHVAIVNGIEEFCGDDHEKASDLFCALEQAVAFSYSNWAVNDDSDLQPRVIFVMSPQSLATFPYYLHRFENICDPVTALNMI